MEILPKQGRGYEIKGNEFQVVEFNLSEVGEVIAEAGNLFYMSDDVKMEATTGEDGILGAITSVIKRKIMGESLFLTKFYGNGIVAFSGERLGKIIPVRLTGESIYAQKDAFLCGIGKLELGVALQRSIGGGLFGGEGFILEKITGEGIVFLNATGYVESFTLENNRIRVETGKAVAWSGDIDYDVVLISDVKTALFGEEGLFLTRLSGKGTVILQSHDLNSFERKILNKVEEFCN